MLLDTLEDIDKTLQNIQTIYDEEGYYDFTNITDKLPKGWHTTNLDVRQLKKLEIPYYRIVNKNAANSNIKIIPNEFSDKEHKYIEMQKAKEKDKIEYVNQIELDKKIIALCLYTIDIESNKIKNTKSRTGLPHGFTFINGPYDSIRQIRRNSINKKEALENLKQVAFHGLIQKWKLTSIGYDDENHDIYTIEGYQFNVDEPNNKICIKKIEDGMKIKRKCCIELHQAIGILVRFLVEEEKCGNFIELRTKLDRS